MAKMDGRSKVGTWNAYHHTVSLPSASVRPSGHPFAFRIGIAAQDRFPSSSRPPHPQQATPLVRPSASVGWMECDGRADEGR